ncbi:type II toxin-antitoxin system RelB/DinJ family antitoxin [Rhodoblastus sp.]
MLHVRVDDKIKKEAAETLESMGLSVSDAVRLFLRRVVADRAIPFEIKAPNATTRAAMAETDEIVKIRQARFGEAVKLFADLEKACDE